jgi:hypothetical protein
MIEIGYPVNMNLMTSMKSESTMKFKIKGLLVFISGILLVTQPSLLAQDYDLPAGVKTSGQMTRQEFERMMGNPNKNEQVNQSRNETVNRFKNQTVYRQRGKRSYQNRPRVRRYAKSQDTYKKKKDKKNNKNRFRSSFNSKRSEDIYNKKPRSFSDMSRKYQR